MPISIEVTLYVNHADSDRMNSNIRFNGEAENVEEAKKIALELHRLSDAIGTMQAPGPVTEVKEPKRPKDVAAASQPEEPASGTPQSSASSAEVPNETPSPSGEPSAPTGGSSSPALDYAKDVKPVTIRLSKEKGRETTIAVLRWFGVKGAQELDAAQWAEYIAHCEKVLAGGEV